MKWRRKQGRHEYMKSWHVWFAWRPVYAAPTKQYVWLEFIWRRGNWQHAGRESEWVWQYAIELWHVEKEPRDDQTA